jgi:predicted lipoprotein with Yx(FWY)xxD motif
MIRLMAIGATAGALLLAGCGGDDDDGETAAPGAVATTETGPSATTSQEKPAEPTQKGTKIELSSSDYGQILFDERNQAIYLFDKESGPTSECYGDCASAWPPVLTKGDPLAGKGLASALIGTTERRDGTTQVTYNGHPLYYYAHEGPGQVLCQGVDEFGGLWLVVRASGNPVRGS